MINQSNKLVSVVIPTYNRAHTLTRSLDSVLKQKYRPIEIIVVDDGSTDNTQAFIKNYSVNNNLNDNNTIYLINLLNSENLWIWLTRNIGIAAAKGQYIAFIDSDDEWIVQDKLTAQVNFLEQNPDCEFVWTWWENISTWPWPKFQWKAIIDLRKDPLALEYYLIHTSTWLITSSLQKRVWWFVDTRCEDYDFLLRCGKYSRIACLGYVTELHYNGQGSHIDNYIKDFLFTFVIIFRYRKYYLRFWQALFWRILRWFLRFFSIRKF